MTLTTFSVLKRELRSVLTGAKEEKNTWLEEKKVFE